MPESPTTKDYLQVIGLIVYISNHLEATIARSIGHLVSNDQGMNTRITAGETSANLIRLLSALFHYRVKDKVTRKQFDGLIERITKAISKRNKHIHAKWIDQRGTMEDRYRTSKMNLKEFTIDREKPSIKILYAIHKEIATVRLELFDFIADHQQEIFEHRQKMSNLSEREQVHFNIEDFFPANQRKPPRKSVIH